MPRRSGVVVVGSFNVDHVWRSPVLPLPGATLAGEYASGPGGKGFNQAMAAVRAGAGTTFLCALGDDAGGALAHRLAEADAIVLLAAPSALPTGTAGLFVDHRGNNSIVIGPGANATLDAAFIASKEPRIAAAAVVLAQLETPVAAVERALAIGRAGGATTLLNPAPANAPATAALLALADVLTPNETEFAAMVARHLAVELDAATVADSADDTLHALCRSLLPAGSVVVTLGAAGCFVSHAEATRHGDHAACYRVAAAAAVPVDTTGAGDAFNGALAASLSLRDAPFAVHAGFANRYAARSTEAEGAALAMPRMRP
jgi:ribokinase